MKEHKAILVTKRDIRENLLLREYQLYANNVISSIEHRAKTKDVGVQYNSRKDNVICTCRNHPGLRRHHEARLFSPSPKQIYAYHRSRSFTEIGVGSIKSYPKKKVKRIYMPVTDERGVGSSEVTNVTNRKTKYNRGNSYIEHVKTSSKCVGGAPDSPIQSVVSAKLSPIVHTKSGSTSPQHHWIGKDTQIGSNTVTKEVVTTPTQIEAPESNFKTRPKKVSETIQKASMESKKVSQESRKSIQKNEEKAPPIEAIKSSKSKTPKTPELEKESEKGYLKKPIQEEKSFSSDSLVTQVHNFDDSGDIKPQIQDQTENKLEREYQMVFNAKTKDHKPDSNAEKTLPEKSTSLFRRRFTALKRTLGKKESKGAVLSSGRASVTSLRDVSVTSDPPSLESRSLSNTTPANSRPHQQMWPKNSYKNATRRPIASRNWSKTSTIDSEYATGVKGMFKLWGKKFNLDDYQDKDDVYQKESSHRKEPYQRKESSHRRDLPGRKQESHHKKDPSQTPLEDKVETKDEDIPEETVSAEKIEPEKERKEKRKFSFFKKKKSKDTKVKEPYKQKKGVTTGRCEVKDGLTIKIGGPPAPAPKKKIDRIPENYEEVLRTAWLMKFLTSPIESGNSVNVRWNNKTYATSSSTVFELMESVYKDTPFILRSKSEVATDESASRYKTFNQNVQNVNFVQNVEAWMIPRTITDYETPQIPMKTNNTNNEDNNMKLTISDQKWYIDKSKAFANKIEVVMHSNNIVTPGKPGTSTEYLRIDIPQGFFSDESEKTSSDEPQAVHTSDEEVYKIVNYESKPSNHLKESVSSKVSNSDDHVAKNIQVKISIKDGFEESTILETVIKKPPAHRDVVTQKSKVFIPKICDVIGVGIITQRDLREKDIRPPDVIRVDRYLSEEDSGSNRSLTDRKNCNFAESYLQEYYKHWNGMELFSWCHSDSHLRCCSDESRESAIGDGCRSCPNIYGDYVAQTSGSSGSCSPVQSFACEQQRDCCQKVKKEKKAKEKKAKEAKKNPPDPKFARVLPKDSLEVFKKRKCYAIGKSRWGQESEPYSVPSNEDRGVQNNWSRRCGLKKVGLPDCQEMLESKPCNPCEKPPPPGILTFGAKKEGSKKCLIVNPDPCTIDDPKCCDPCPPSPSTGSDKKCCVAPKAESATQCCKDKSVSPTCSESKARRADCGENAPTFDSADSCKCPPKCENEYPWPATEQCSQHASIHSPIQSVFRQTNSDVKCECLAIGPKETRSYPDSCSSKCCKDPPLGCKKTMSRDRECDANCSQKSSVIASLPCSPQGSKTNLPPCSNCPLGNQSSPVRKWAPLSPPKLPPGPPPCKKKSPTTHKCSPITPRCPPTPPNCPKRKTPPKRKQQQSPTKCVCPPSPPRCPPLPKCPASQPKCTPSQPKCPPKCQSPPRTPPKCQTPPRSQSPPKCRTPPRSRSPCQTPPRSRSPCQTPPRSRSPCQTPPKTRSPCQTPPRTRSPRRTPPRTRSPCRTPPRTRSPCQTPPRSRSPPCQTLPKTRSPPKCTSPPANRSPKKCPSPPILKKSPPCSPRCPTPPKRVDISTGTPECTSRHQCTPSTPVGGSRDNSPPRTPPGCITPPRSKTGEPPKSSVCGDYVRVHPYVPPEPPYRHKTGNMSGIHLKMVPKQKSDDDDDLECLDQIILKFNNDTSCPQDCSGGMKVQDEDGRTIVERKDYTVHRNVVSDRTIPYLSSIYKDSKVTPINVCEMTSVDRDKEAEQDKGSNTSIANIIEINFKLRVTQGDKTAEINLSSEENKEASNKNQDKEVFIVKNENEASVDDINPKNDLNIRILIKNYRTKSDIKKEKQETTVDDFSKKISRKFKTVSTGYSTDLKPDLDDTISIHRATIDLTTSGDKSKMYLESKRVTPEVITAKPSRKNIYDIIKKLSTKKRKSEPLVKASSRSDFSDVEPQSDKPLVKASSRSDFSDVEPQSDKIVQKVSIKNDMERIYKNHAKMSLTNSIEHDNSLYNKTSNDRTDLANKTSDERTDLGNKLSDERTDPGNKTSDDRTDLVNKTSDDRTDLANKTSDDRTDLANKTSDDRTDLGNKTSEEPTDIGNKTSEDRTYTDIAKSSDEIESDTKTSDVVIERISSDEVTPNLAKKTRKEEKKEMLKQVFENANYLKKPRTKNRIQKLKDILKSILTSDSEADDATVAREQRAINQLTKQYASMTRTISMTFSRAESILPIYPTLDNTSCCSEKGSELSPHASRDTPRGCICSTFAQRLNAEGCCCKKTYEDKDVSCDILNYEDLDISSHDSSVSVKYADADTQNSKYSSATKVFYDPGRSTSRTDEAKSSTKLVLSNEAQDSNTKITDLLSVKSAKLTKTLLPQASPKLACESRVLNTQTRLGISDEDKIIFLQSNSTRLSKQYHKQKKEKGRYMSGAEILQLYETKKAVLEIYAEKTLTDDGEHMVAKLPKFVYERENEICDNYKGRKNSYSVCRENFVMMSIGR